VDLRAGLDDLEKRKFLTLPGLELQQVAKERNVTKKNYISELRAG
jgi:hypothetical protein